MEHWFLFAVFGGISSNIYNFLTRFALKDGDDSTTFAWFFECIRFFIFGIIILFQPLPALNFKNTVSFFIIGGVEVASIYTFMKMHSYSHLSLSSIIIRFRLI